MQQLDSPRNRNVVSNVVKEVMRNRQNRATGTSEITLTGHDADMPKSTQMVGAVGLGHAATAAHGRRAGHQHQERLAALASCVQPEPSPKRAT